MPHDGSPQSPSKMRTDVICYVGNSLNFGVRIRSSADEGGLSMLMRSHELQASGIAFFSEGHLLVVLTRLKAEA